PLGKPPRRRTDSWRFGFDPAPFRRDAEVGVKWKVHRGYAPASVAPSDACGLRSCRRWHGLPFVAGAWASTVLRKRMSSWCRWRCMFRPRLGWVQLSALDLAPLIDREYDVMLGRIDIKADNILQFLGKR